MELCRRSILSWHLPPTQGLAEVRFCLEPDQFAVRDEPFTALASAARAFFCADPALPAVFANGVLGASGCNSRANTSCNWGTVNAGIFFRGAPFPGSGTTAPAGTRSCDGASRPNSAPRTGPDRPGPLLLAASPQSHGADCGPRPP